MLHVTAKIQFQREKHEQLLEIYQELVPEVLKEEGCIQYTPTKDFDLELANQEKDISRLLVTEIWESEKAFRAHLNAPHVLKFRDQIKGIVEKVTVQITEPILNN